MSGDDKARFCSKCEKHVHDLSVLTEAQADAFVEKHQNQPVCIRFKTDRRGTPLFRPTIPPVHRVAVVAALSLALAACAGYAEEEDLSNPDAALVCHDAHGYAIACTDVEPLIPDQNSTRDPWRDDEEVTDDDPGPESEQEQFVRGAMVFEEVDEGGQVEEDEGEGCPIRGRELEDSYSIVGVSYATVGVMAAPANRRQARRRTRRTRRQETRALRRAARR